MALRFKEIVSYICRMDLSIVVPAFNEDESLRELLAEIMVVTEKEGYEWEIIFVDDGSTDNTWAVIEELHEKHPMVRGIKFQRNYGKAAALHTGFRATRGKVVITMDADLQDRPQHIPEFYKMIVEDGYDLVSGWKQKRKDPLTKTIPTKLYNGVNRLVSGIKLHDQNCGFKSYRREVVQTVEVYGDMHRYIPVIAKANGFGKIGELRVEHIARKYGTTKYGWNRFINGMLDLLTITFLTRYGKRPMHFFGFWALILLFAGGGVLGYLYIRKLLGEFGAIDPYYIGDRIPALFFGTTTVLLGTLLLFTGLLAELIGRSSATRNEYMIATELEAKNQSSV